MKPNPTPMYAGRPSKKLGEGVMLALEYVLVVQKGQV